jgi:hypothetical protein
MNARRFHGSTLTQILSLMDARCIGTVHATINVGCPLRADAYECSSDSTGRESLFGVQLELVCTSIVLNSYCKTSVMASSTRASWMSSWAFILRTHGQMKHTTLKTGVLLLVRLRGFGFGCNSTRSYGATTGCALISCLTLTNLSPNIHSAKITVCNT